MGPRKVCLLLQVQRSFVTTHSIPVFLHGDVILVFTPLCVKYDHISFRKSYHSNFHYGHASEGVSWPLGFTPYGTYSFIYVTPPKNWDTVVTKRIVFIQPIFVVHTLIGILRPWEQPSRTNSNIAWQLWYVSAKLIWANGVARITHKSLSRHMLTLHMNIWQHLSQHLKCFFTRLPRGVRDCYV